MKVAILLFLIVSTSVTGKNPSNVRITGGGDATPHGFPYQAFLEIDGRDYIVYCGGVLISENYVLTSASCVENAKHANITLGMHSLLEAEDTQVIIASSKITPHELYFDEERLNDLAMIELSEAAPISDAIQIIPLVSQANANDDLVGKSGQVTGWGLTDGSADSVLAETLKYVEVDVISNEDCGTYFGRLTESVLCTSGSDNKGICHGDEGGPLVVDGVLVGLASFTDEFCVSGFPSVFTRIGAYLDWIGTNSDVVIG